MSKVLFFGRCFAKKVYQMHIIPTVLTKRKYGLFSCQWFKLKGCKKLQQKKNKSGKNEP